MIKLLKDKKELLRVYNELFSGKRFVTYKIDGIKYTIGRRNIDVIREKREWTFLKRLYNSVFPYEYYRPEPNLFNFSKHEYRYNKWNGQWQQYVEYGLGGFWSTIIQESLFDKLESYRHLSKTFPKKFK